jgi:hypothetical protein
MHSGREAVLMGGVAPPNFALQRTAASEVLL